MKPSDAQRQIREIASDSSRIVIVPHAASRMRERRIDFLDVHRCLRGGYVIDGPAHANPGNSLFRCTVEGTVTGRILHVVVEIEEIRSKDDSDESQKIIVITAFIRE